MVGRRSELLARVVLTRRLNIDVFDLDLGSEMGIDFLGSIRDEKVPGVLLFGVIVWGTPDELDTPEDAEKHVRTHRKKINKRPRYFIPVIVLLFSMHKDEAFFSWVVEPCENSSQLLEVPGLHFSPFDVKQLDSMTKRITRWYKRLAVNILSDVRDTDASQCPEDE
jgi:hypothetical protein